MSDPTLTPASNGTPSTGAPDPPKTHTGMGGCLAVVFLWGTLTNGVIFLILPFCGVEVPLWVKVADGVVFIVLVAAAAIPAICSRRSETKPPTGS